MQKGLDMGGIIDQARTSFHSSIGKLGVVQGERRRRRMWTLSGEMGRGRTEYLKSSVAASMASEDHLALSSGSREEI